MTQSLHRDSRLEVLYKKNCSRKFSKILRKTSVFRNTVAGCRSTIFLKKAPAKLFSCEFSKTFRTAFQMKPLWIYFYLYTRLTFLCLLKKNLVLEGSDYYLEAILRKCSSKQVFLKISQISQENTCTGVSLY